MRTNRPSSHLGSPCLVFTIFSPHGASHAPAFTCCLLVHHNLPWKLIGALGGLTPAGPFYSNVSTGERRLLRATLVPRSTVEVDLDSEASGNMDLPPPSPQSVESSITQSPRSPTSQTSSVASTTFSVGPAGLPSSSSLISGWIGRGAPRRDFSTGENSKREYGLKTCSPKKRAAGQRKSHSKSRHSSEPRQAEELLGAASRVVPSCLPQLTKSTSEKAEDEKCSIATLKMELKDMVVS